MPLRKIRDGDRERIVRAAYAPRDYTAPQDFLDDVRKHFAVFGSRELLANTYEGPFVPLRRVREFVRNGKQYVLVVRYSNCPHFGLEIELTDFPLGEMRALLPDEAWQLVRELDARYDANIGVEDSGA